MTEPELGQDRLIRFPLPRNLEVRLRHFSSIYTDLLRVNIRAMEWPSFTCCRGNLFAESAE